MNNNSYYQKKYGVDPSNYQNNEVPLSKNSGKTDLGNVDPPWTNYT